MDININKSNQGDFNGVEIVKNEEKTKPTSIDYMIILYYFLILPKALRAYPHCSQAYQIQFL